MKSYLKIRSTPNSSIISLIVFLLIFLLCTVLSLINFILTPSGNSFGYFVVALLFEASLIWFGSKYVLPGRQKYVIVDDNGINFVCQKRKVEIKWSHIEKLTLQGFVPNDFRGGFAVLSFDYNKDAVDLSEINIPYFLFRKETDLASFLGSNKPDIAISLKFMKESENKVLHDIFQRNGFSLVKTKPLIQCKTQDEYNEIFEANFDINSFN